MLSRGLRMLGRRSGQARILRQRQTTGTAAAAAAAAAAPASSSSGAAPATAAASATATSIAAEMATGDPVATAAEASSPYKHIVVVGGSGYVGSEICRQAIGRGHTVTSVNSRGRPASLSSQNWASHVKWVKASVFEPETWEHTVNDQTVVVSSVGALGNAETMERMNGDANVAACETAASRGAAKFVLISASPMNAESLDFGRKLPVLGAYINAKHRAEQSALENFGKGAPKPGRSRSDNGTESTAGDHQAGDAASTEVLQNDAFALIRPGFIFGTKGGIPLHVVGIPMRLIFSTLQLNRIPGLGPIFFEPPVAVSEVAKAAVAACEQPNISGPIKTEQIQSLARAVNHS